ncbi:MAG: N-acetyl-gamma-glutamyl-phosphate reductase [Firmicutes bacterium]|nr:N-acetyl-gamma-glutamyl-phosphate reductase [Bacillota bacterium]
MIKVFIDGKEGTTGLQIADRLKARKDIALLELCEEERKSPLCRKEAINSSDITILCLPDDIAKESVSLAEGKVRIIDASTAHRTEKGWAYGLPELSKEFENGVINGNRVCVPGCHASGFLALVYPLIAGGYLDKSARLSCTSLTGYSGGGKKMIERYQDKDNYNLLNAPAIYAVAQQHKHLKEMVKISGLDNAPCFNPIVCNFYSGMLVFVPLPTNLLNFSKEDLSGEVVLKVREILARHYNNGNGRIKVLNAGEGIHENGTVIASRLSGSDNMEIMVEGSKDNITLYAVYDNLGKGASGGAVQCLDLMLKH